MPSTRASSRACAIRCLHVATVAVMEIDPQTRECVRLNFEMRAKIGVSAVTEYRQPGSSIMHCPCQSEQLMTKMEKPRFVGMLRKAVNNSSMPKPPSHVHAAGRFRSTNGNHSGSDLISRGNYICAKLPNSVLKRADSAHPSCRAFICR